MASKLKRRKKPETSSSPHGDPAIFAPRQNRAYHRLIPNHFTRCFTGSGDGETSPLEEKVPVREGARARKTSGSTIRKLIGKRLFKISNPVGKKSKRKFWPSKTGSWYLDWISTSRWLPKTSTSCPPPLKPSTTVSPHTWSLNDISKLDSEGNTMGDKYQRNCRTRADNLPSLSRGIHKLSDPSILSERKPLSASYGRSHLLPSAPPSLPRSPTRQRQACHIQNCVKCRAMAEHPHLDKKTSSSFNSLGSSSQGNKPSIPIMHSGSGKSLTRKSSSDSPRSADRGSSDEMDYTVSTVDIEEQLKEDSNSDDESDSRSGTVLDDDDDDDDDDEEEEEEGGEEARVEEEEGDEDDGEYDNAKESPAVAKALFKPIQFHPTRNIKSASESLNKNPMHEAHRCKSEGPDNENLKGKKHFPEMRRSEGLQNIPQKLYTQARDKVGHGWKSRRPREVVLTSTGFSLVTSDPDVEDLPGDSSRKTQLPGFAIADTQALSDEVWRRIQMNQKLSSRMADRPAFLECDILTYVTKDGEYLKLGSGTYGDVFLGKLIPSGLLVAVKLYLKKVSSYGSLLTEASTLQRLNQTGCTPHFHGLVALEPSEKYLSYATIIDFVGSKESLKPEDLRAFVKRQKKLPVNQNLSQQQWYGLIRDYIKAVDRIHECGIVINDVKMDNTLLMKVNDKYRVFIIDFGISSLAVGGREFSFAIENDDVEAFLKEYTQIAPELVYSKRSRPESDLYGLGAVLLSLSYKLDDRNLRRMGRLCRAADPEDRPSAKSLAHTLDKCILRMTAFKRSKEPTKEVDIEE